MQNTPETQAILQRMKEVRCDLDEGAQEIAESASDLADWRYYVKSYPWICVGAAAALGYVIVPWGRFGLEKVNKTLDEMADQNRQTSKSNTRSKSGVRSAIGVFAGNLLWRSASRYAARKANDYFASESATSPPEDQP